MTRDTLRSRHRHDDPLFFVPLGDDFGPAVLAWSLGCNTAEIASRLGRHESVVANALPDIREAARRLQHREAAE